MKDQRELTQGVDSPSDEAQNFLEGTPCLVRSHIDLVSGAYHIGKKK